jgi:hypothetical protein
MATVKLDVPVLAQEKTWCCWHTAANMIWLYSQGKSGRQGPMNTIMPVYEDNTGLPVSAQAFIVLAQKTGLKALPTKNLHSEGDVYSYLHEHGPLWSAGAFGFNGSGHAIVLTGIDGGTVHINDPDGGRKKTETIAWFNDKLLNAIPGCLMYKDPAAY